MKRLIIGDIHGCYTEFLELLKKANLSKDDEIIALGDILDRGPDSRKVMHFFMNEPRTQTLLGNHERKHILSFQGKVKSAPSQRITRRQLGEEYYPSVISWMEKLPHFIDLPEAVLIHGFFEPHIPLSSQKEILIVGVISGEVYLKENYDRPWHELYDGDKPLIAGHKDYLKTGEPLIYKDRVFCIDTDCCRGGRLTGLLLPEFKIISVPSRRNYWEEMKYLYGDNKHFKTSFKELSWKDIDGLLVNAEEQTDLPPEGIKRISEFKDLFSKGEKILKALFEHIIEENERILKELREKSPYDELNPGEQGSVYARYLGKGPLAGYLHLARKGEMTLDVLRTKFKGPAELIKFAGKLKISKIKKAAKN